MLERLIAELSAACSQIGYDLGHKYELDANCFGTFFYLNKFYSKKNLFFIFFSKYNKHFFRGHQRLHQIFAQR